MLGNAMYSKSSEKLWLAGCGGICFCGVSSHEGISHENLEPKRLSNPCPRQGGLDFSRDLLLRSRTRACNCW